MNEFQVIKDLAPIIAPLTKGIVDEWVKPKLRSIGEKWLKDKKKQDHFFSNKFTKYLEDKYKSYFYINILALRHRKREIKQIYQPLTITTTSYSKKQETLIESYESSFFEKNSKTLIIDTAGMGKSTLSKILFLSCLEKNEGIPLFIELRRLNNENGIVDEIFNELGLINEDVDKQFILDLINRGDFIIFLDGYDEIGKEVKREVTTDLQKFIEKSSNNKFILTSRQSDSLISFRDFSRFTIKPLKKEEAFELIKKYDPENEISVALIDKLEENRNRNIQEFLTNPFLTSLLFTAFEHKRTIPLRKHLFYRQVYDALFESHDLSKGDFFIRPKNSKLGIDDFHTVLRYLAFICLKEDQIEFTKDELLNFLKNVKEEIDVISFKESKFLEDLIELVPLFIKEGLRYKWSHKSLFEYFAAQYIYQDSDDKRKNILKVLADKNHRQYDNMMDIYSNIDFKSFRNEYAAHFIRRFVENTEKLIEELNISKPKLIERSELTYGNSTKYFLTGYDHGFISINDLAQNLNDKGIKNYSYRVVTNFCKKRFTPQAYFLVTEKSGNTNLLIINILKTYNDKLIKQVKYPTEENNIQIKNFPHLEKISFDGNKENIINKKTNFTTANYILRSYLGNSFVLDYEKCKEYIEQLDEKNSRNNIQDYFNLN